LKDLTLRWKLIVLLKAIKEYKNISAKDTQGFYELKKHKPWFCERLSKLLNQRKLTILQWLRDPSEINGDNLNNVKREVSRHFMNKRGSI
jgi:hypothetical protein